MSHVSSFFRVADILMPVVCVVKAVARSALETGTLDLDGQGLTSLPSGVFQDARTLSAVTRAKLSGNKLQVRACTRGMRSVEPVARALSNELSTASQRWLCPQLMLTMFFSCGNVASVQYLQVRG